MRNAIADLVISFAADGETDPKQLKTMTLAALPRALQEQIARREYGMQTGGREGRL
jgi:hypothetical protein